MSGANDRLLAAAAAELRRNPLPVVLIGVGAAWLAVETARRPAGERPAGYFDIYEGYDPDEGVSAWLAARMAVARTKLSGAVDQARDQASALARAVRTRAYRVAARRKLGAAVEAETLAAGAIGLAIGVAIGMGVASRRRARQA
jgi:hypothetical protein